MRYSNTFTYSRYKRTLQLSNGPRLKDSMRQFMASLSVEAYDLKVVKPQADEPLSSMLSSSQWGLGAVCHSPGPWGPDPQQAAAGAGGASFKRSALGPVSQRAHTLPGRLAADPSGQACGPETGKNVKLQHHSVDPSSVLLSCVAAGDPSEGVSRAAHAAPLGSRCRSRSRLDSGTRQPAQRPPSHQEPSGTRPHSSRAQQRQQACT